MEQATKETTGREYQGWANYETWAVKLWMDNEQGAYNYWREATQEAIANAPDAEEVADGIWTPENAAKFHLADHLKNEHEEQLPEVKGFAADLLRGAFSEVNWTEIAASLIETETNG